MSEKKKLKLKSSDVRIFFVEEHIAIQSIMLRLMVKDGCASNTIPLPKVNSKTLVMVIYYWKQHVDPKVEQVDLEAFDAQFVDKDQATLYDFLMTANYLNIPSLLDKLFQKIADMIKGKSLKKI
ncbi:SKP1-like protein 1A [Diospyros lotus]|uniref:SKP1-like protein 1A n=1 Tax=Diospyros lotus TaxID=55363 RepID=UPI0022593DEB|nr:SKP1-like protein 1A [Diospyros lotus]